MIAWIKSIYTRLTRRKVYVVQIHVDFKYPYSYILGVYKTGEQALTEAGKEISGKVKTHRYQIWTRELR